MKKEVDKKALIGIANKSLQKAGLAKRWRVDDIERTELDSEGCNWSEVRFTRFVVVGERTMAAKVDEILLELRKGYNLK